MSNAAARAPQANLADYEPFVAGRPDDQRWEWIDGVIETMTTPAVRHGIIVGNIFARLKLSVDRSGCRALARNRLVQRSDARGAPARPTASFSMPSVFPIDLDTVHPDVPVPRPAEPPEGDEDDVPVPIP